MTAIVEKGRKLAVQCTGMDREGAATATEGAFIVHVAGALPGERVTTTVAHVSTHLQAGQRHAWATLDTIELASPERDAPPCPAHGPCTSCPLMNWATPAQLRWKRDLVAQALAAYPSLAEVPIAECVASPLPLGYRGNAKLVYGWDRENHLVLGAYAPRSHAIVDMTGCPLSEPVLVEVAAVLHKLLLENDRVGGGGLCPPEPERGKVWRPSEGFQPFDEIRRTGVLRYVLMRANGLGKVLVTLVSARADWPQAQALAQSLAATCPAVCGVVLNVNASTGNVLLGEEEHLLWGADFIEDEIGPARVRLGPRSFAQANRRVAGLAYAAIVSAAERLGTLDRVVDVYAGAGGIALSLAPLAAEVVAIEENPAAAATAQAFVDETATGARVRFVAGDAAEHLAQVGHADVVVLNPPRKGCAPAVLAAVAQLGPRLVAYLSCNPETLARDLAVLAAAGLRCAGVTPYDMLAHTPHIESLALLYR